MSDNEPAGITRCRELAREDTMDGYIDTDHVTVLLQYYDNAKARLRLAREALLADGYFTPDQISGDEIAPRIRERLAALRDELNPERHDDDEVRVNPARMSTFEALERARGWRGDSVRDTLMVALLARIIDELREVPRA